MHNGVFERWGAKTGKTEARGTINIREDSLGFSVYGRSFMVEQEVESRAHVPSQVAPSSRNS